MTPLGGMHQVLTFKINSGAASKRTAVSRRGSEESGENHRGAQIPNSIVLHQLGHKYSSSGGRQEKKSRSAEQREEKIEELSALNNVFLCRRAKSLFFCPYCVKLLK